MKIGYARVSTEEQNLDLQISALTVAGCDTLYEDHGVSGTTFSRPGLDAALLKLGKNDTLVVWRLDRLGRSLSKLVELMESLNKREVHFVSLTESISTTSSGGMFMFHMMAALAQFERSLISERTIAGMKAARDRGQRIGRQRSLTPQQCEEAVLLLTDGSTADVAAKFNVHPRTLQRMLRRAIDS
ncbi:recombinase family protein [Caballeronia sp. dw_19]|jgi:DNA invertase Pin-like site-specific DNA recombinase|uniref:recombinase family protein n=1 Tax=unclassified Caballeronia TaxID=2646786 RepID=UPI001BD607BA|nr:recombinase family protein [Caballeronia sp. dw_19]